jgi:hypothetical protein
MYITWGGVGGWRGWKRALKVGGVAVVDRKVGQVPA